MTNAVLQIHRNRLASESVIETHPSSEPARWDAVLDFFHPGIHCVRRCYIYAGNYTVHTKAEMEKRGEYGQVELVAFEGRYSDCRRFARHNQAYERWDN